MQVSNRTIGKDTPLEEAYISKIKSPMMIQKSRRITKLGVNRKNSEHTPRLRGCRTKRSLLFKKKGICGK